MKCIFLYNPNSGKGKISSYLKDIEKILKKKFDEVVVYATKSSEDTIAIAKDSCNKYDAIIFAGGDGTFNDIACGVSECYNRPKIGYIPAGTVNDISRNLGISRNYRKALKTILDGETTFHDVGLINDRYFMYVSGTGTFTGVSYRTQQRAKKAFGKLAYVLDGLRDFVDMTIRKVRIETETEIVEMEVPLVLVVNSISVGGISFNKNGHLNDGEFDIILVKKGRNYGLLNIFKLFTFGIRRRKVTNHFITLKSSNFKIYVDDEAVWCVDGELGPKGNVDIKNLHNHIEVYVPKNKR